MYKDRLLNLGGLSFSFKGVIWSLCALALSVGLLDRIIAIFQDGHLIASKLLQLLVITAILISWFSLKPSSRLNGNFATGIDEIINLEAKNNLEHSLIPIKHDDIDSINPH